MSFKTLCIAWRHFLEVAPSASVRRSAMFSAWKRPRPMFQSKLVRQSASRWSWSPATLPRAAKSAVQNFTQSSAFSAATLSNFSTPELAALSVSSGEAIEDNYHDL